jgi:hypothetical protein
MIVLRQALENSFAATMNRYAPAWMFEEAFSISVAVFKGVQQDLGSSFAVWSIFHHGQALNGLSLQVLCEVLLRKMSPVIKHSLRFPGHWSVSSH